MFINFASLLLSNALFTFFLFYNAKKIKKSSQLIPGVVM